MALSQNKRTEPTWEPIIFKNLEPSTAHKVLLYTSLMYLYLFI